MFNSVTFQGNTGKAFSVKETSNGKMLAVGSVMATLSATRSKEGTWEEEKIWLNVHCWGFLAEKATKIPKGSKVVVTGRLRNYQSPDFEWEPGEVGLLVIEANSLDMLASPPSEEGSGGGKKPRPPKKKRRAENEEAPPYEETPGEAAGDDFPPF